MIFYKTCSQLHNFPWKLFSIFFVRFILFLFKKHNQMKNPRILKANLSDQLKQSYLHARAKP